MRRFLLLWTAAACACGPDAKPAPAGPTVAAAPDAGPPPAARWRLTVAAATVDGKKPDGKDWDDGKSDPRPTAAPSEPLAAYLAQHPELSEAAEWLGEPVLGGDAGATAKKTTAADPMVFVEAGGRIYRSPMIPGSFAPVWSFTLMTPELAADGHITVVVVDRDGPDHFDVIGSTVVPLQGRQGPALLELPRFGGVAAMTVELSPWTPPAETLRRLAVPAHPSWTDTGVDVIAGQTVTIEAAGEVCTRGGDRNACGGPEGQPAAAESNLVGFPRRGHAALVGAIGDTRFYVGRDATVVAPSSGKLLLGVNDRNDGDNKGAFDVRVTVK